MGRAVLVIAMSAIVLWMAWLGAGIAAFSTGGPDGGIAGLLIGFALVLCAGVLLGVVIRPIAASSRRPSLIAGIAFLGAAALGLASAVAWPAVSVALRSGWLAPLFSPLGMALVVVLGTALLVARRSVNDVENHATQRRRTGPRAPPPE